MAKPTLALIPASQGSKLFSVLPSSGVGDFDFSRGSAATRINSQGLIEAVVSGQSRLDYPLIDGVVNGCPSLLLENSATNLVTYSEDFNQSSWNKTNCTIISNNSISPNGTQNADKLVENNIINSFSNRNSTSVSYTSGLKYTISIFAKSDGRDLMIRSYNGSSDIDTIFDLSNGIILSGSSGEIKNYGNGWYRCSHTITAQSTINTVYSASFILANGSSISYQGDGTSGAYIYGAMLEQGSYPSSYIPTNGESGGVTRSAETANGSGDASTFNDSEGVLMAEISALADDNTNRYITLSDSAISNRVNIFFDASNNLRGFVNGISSISSGVAIQGTNKCAFKYKSGDIAFWVNGIEVGTRTSTLSLTGLSQISFNLTPGNNVFYGKTKQLQYYNTALTDSELEQLTSWISFTDMANGQLYTIE